MIDLKKLLPVGAAIALFVTLSLAYFSPVLEGYNLSQGDIKQWQGMAQEIVEFRDSYGTEPLWTNSMFSGMPAYQISVIWEGNVLRWVDRLFHGFLPLPAGFLFLYLIGMYILLMCLRVDPWLAIVGSLAFAFSSYFFVILEAGHNSKANAVGYMPAVLGGLYLLYRGRVWVGFAVFALFMALEVSMNHVQVTYYLGMLMLLFVLAEAWRSVQEKQLPRFLQGSALALVAVVLALACNAGLLWSTYEYGSFSTRGKGELTINADGSSAQANTTGGLDRDYVVQWSYGKQESFSLLVPNAKGGDSRSMISTREDLDAIKDPALRNSILKVYQDGGYVNAYWGDQMFTSGPVYLGAVVVLLMLLALGRAEGHGRWWVLGALVVVPLMLAISSPVGAFALLAAYLLAGIFLWRDTLGYALFAGLLLTLALSWGSNYMPLTDFFLDHIPGYNKFRAVTIILVIVELCAPVLAVLYLDKLLKEERWDTERLRSFLVPAGALALLLLAMAAMPGTLFDFISEQERDRFVAQAEAGGPAAAQVSAYVDGLKALRMDVFRADVLRSLLFVLAAGALVFLAGRRVIGRSPLLAGLGLLILVDQWAVDKRYVNNEQEKGRYLRWERKDETRVQRAPDKADMAIYQAEATPAVEAEFKAMLAQVKERKSAAGVKGALVNEAEQAVLRFSALRRHVSYRVAKLRDPFQDATVSYLHRSIGGYHGAKLKRYQELIEFHLVPELGRMAALFQGGTTQREVDSVMAGMNGFNMLNTRYFIYDPSKPPLRNPHGCGAAWFARELRWVKSADEEITALRTIDPRTTVLVDERFRTAIGEGAVEADSTATVALTDYRTDHLTYKARSARGGVVVFSEIWYGPDWHAYVDGQPVEHARVNYVLRGLRVPSGEHTIEFRIESRPYTTGGRITMAGSIVVLLLALGVLGMELWRRRKEGAA
ncbi:MAG: YfhO family protein [Flavobacteriales bacterium]|nr:YfhO family protein [Flavobacteriales bacterium]